MTWLEFHRQSEAMASTASVAARAGNPEESNKLYGQAAELERKALEALDPSKTRTFGITAVSILSLLFKAGEFDKVEIQAYRMLAEQKLPEFAVENTRLIVQAVWNERAKSQAGVSFLPGEVLISVKGGEVIFGGAPLDLIVDKVQIIQSLFYRTLELMKGLPHRMRGGPSRDVMDACRPWLLQAPPGSYQFSVAIQGSAQSDFFRHQVSPDDVALKFLTILKAATEDEARAMTDIIPDSQYRSTFLKLTRNLAPTGNVFERMEIKHSGYPEGVLLVPQNRVSINKLLKPAADKSVQVDQQQVDLSGILRAVHLDKDWIELISDGKLIHISGVKETVDDVIGPMINKPVTVKVIRHSEQNWQFIDIERIE